MPKTNALLPIEMYHFSGWDLIPGIYQSVSDLGFDYSCNYINIKNRCKNDIYISFDGVNDHEFVRANDRLDVYTLPRFTHGGFRRYSKIYVRGPMSVGVIYVSAYG